MHGWKRCLNLIRTNLAGAKNLTLTACKSATDETDEAILEIAISSSILFAMFFGVFQLSFASYTYHYVSDAAREGARAGLDEPSGIDRQ